MFPGIPNPCPWVWVVLRSRDLASDTVTLTGPTTASCMSLRYIQDEANVVFQTEISLFFNRLSNIIIFQRIQQHIQNNVKSYCIDWGLNPCWSRKNIHAHRIWIRGNDLQIYVHRFSHQSFFYHGTPVQNRCQPQTICGLVVSYHWLI